MVMNSDMYFLWSVLGQLFCFRFSYCPFFQVQHHRYHGGSVNWILLDILLGEVKIFCSAL